ncbi:120_t:CDS:2 [Ambispora gerdemannii]|uniref:120_t:CDS:1 n=1 Tax=Ambispora gerdemannii TaxID=144530 RepID=A0A9N9F6Y0_9GLOM|nr:120_t:CDS:2 [Ambispora gerdemannii]
MFTTGKDLKRTALLKMSAGINILKQTDWLMHHAYVFDWEISRLLVVWLYLFHASDDLVGIRADRCKYC